MTSALIGLDGDLRMADGDLVLDEGLVSAVLVSLLCDAPAADVEPEAQRGYWADPEGDTIGSQLWLLDRGKATAETAARARDAAERALRWLTTEGIAASVDVDASYARQGVLLLEVTLRPRHRAPVGAPLARLRGLRARVRHRRRAGEGDLMALPRPSLAEIRGRASADVAAALSRGPLLERSTLRLLSQSVAGAAHSLYGLLAWIFDQTFPDTAEREQLDRWADLYGTPRRGAAFAEGTVILRGAATLTLAAGARVVREDGVEYETQADATVPVGQTTVEVRVRAVEPGASANTEAGIEVRLGSPELGWQPVGIVAGAEISGGADVESDAELRERIIGRLRNPGQGGNQADYVRWALEVPGVTRAWCHPLLNGYGTVGLSFMRDGDPDPFPSPEAVAQVRDHINQLRPVGMIGVEVFAPTPKPLALSLRVEPDSVQVRTLVAEAIADILHREGGPAPRQPETYLPLSRISEAISSVAGERSHQILSPTAAPSVGPRELLVPGVISWS